MMWMWHNFTKYRNIKWCVICNWPHGVPKFHATMRKKNTLPLQKWAEWSTMPNQLQQLHRSGLPMLRFLNDDVWTAAGYGYSCWETQWQHLAHCPNTISPDNMVIVQVLAWCCGASFAWWCGNWIWTVRCWISDDLDLPHHMRIRCIFIQSPHNAKSSGTLWLNETVIEAHKMHKRNIKKQGKWKRGRDDMETVPETTTKEKGRGRAVTKWPHREMKNGRDGKHGVRCRLFQIVSSICIPLAFACGPSSFSASAWTKGSS